MVTKRERGGANYRFKVSRYTLLYIKQINNKELLKNTANYIQYLIVTYSGKEFEKEYLYINEITLMANGNTLMAGCMRVHNVTVSQFIQQLPTGENSFDASIFSHKQGCYQQPFSL